VGSLVRPFAIFFTLYPLSVYSILAIGCFVVGKHSSQLFSQSLLVVSLFTCLSVILLLQTQRLCLSWYFWGSGLQGQDGFVCVVGEFFYPSTSLGSYDSMTFDFERI